MEYFPAPLEALVEQFARLPGTMALDFAFTVFSGNEIDIDNPIGYPVDLSNAVFE